MCGYHEDLHHGTEEKQDEHYQVVDLATDGHLESHEADDEG